MFVVFVVSVAFFAMFCGPWKVIFRAIYSGQITGVIGSTGWRICSAVVWRFLVVF